MNLAELNMELKEDMELLEEQYAMAVGRYMEIMHIPHTIHSSLKLMSLMCSEQIKAQQGEKSSQSKFDNVEQFAKHFGMMLDIYINDLENKYPIRKY